MTHTCVKWRDEQMYSLFTEVHVPCQYQSCDIFFHVDKILIFVAVKILLQCRKWTRNYPFSISCCISTRADLWVRIYSS